MTIEANLKFEKAVRFMVAHFPPSAENSRKPVLFHDIRVGVYLYQNGYTENIVLAGLLHDVIEWSDVTKDEVEKEFGPDVLQLVLANTKDDAITDKQEKTNELISRCAATGQDALIIKTADILDSFSWYLNQNNEDQLKYCMRNAKAIFKFKRDNFTDKIFEELKLWSERFINLNE
ncbi:TPA: hypothetical protein DF272_02095 [Candidatus Falkowbacteria bacterium]|nr:hypothetical protein [Candidatus Falkowbacteria bacterium]